MAVDRFIIIRNVHLEEKNALIVVKKGHKYTHYRKPKNKRGQKSKKKK